MLSRAAYVPRVYYASRVTSSILSPRTALSHLYGREDWIQQRCYSSDPVIHNKQKIEALISGRLSASEFNKSLKKPSKKPSRKQPWRRRKGASSKHRDKDEEIPDWGLAATANETNIAVEAKAVQELEEDIIEELPAFQEDGEALEEGLEDALEDALAVESDRLEQAAARDGSIIADSVNNAELGQVNLEAEFKPRRTFQDELIQSRSVSVAALGEQIEAIMLKNPNEMKKLKRPVRRIQEEAPGTKIELDFERDHMVDEKEENSEEAMAAALKHIGELRPVERTILRMKDFDSLANILLDGFKFSQLTRYYNQERLAMYNRDLQKPLSYPWVVKQEPWVAAKPDHWGPLRPKQRQVILIIQSIWNLEVQEQVEGLGRTLVWLQPHIFQLITAPNSSILEQVSKEFLYESNKEKITQGFDDCRINIYAQKSTIPVILSYLDEIVKSIRCQKLPSSHIQEHDLDEQSLRELEQITKTHIEHNKGKRELEVSWLENEGLASSTEGAKDMETPADIALRLLLEHPGKDHQSRVHIIAPSEMNKSKDGSFISYQRERRSMRWKDKSRPWSRYVVPVGQAASSEDDISAQLLEAVSLPTSLDSGAKKETEPGRRITTASFGYVLHGKGSRTVAAMAKHRRLLSPVLPHPASFTSIMDEDKPVTQRVTITLNFSPDPKHHPTDTDSILPNIQLQLPVDPDTDIADFSLSSDSGLFGVAAHYVSDVLLPSESVDIRLTQQHLMPLDASQESVKEFLSHSEFNLPKGILRTPSKATFSIPKAWAASPKAKRKPSSKATINVPYMFMGLETHQTVELEFHGHTLRYDSIDAGRHGGHRQELSLQSGSTQSEDKTTLLSQEEMSRFLSIAGGVATGKYFSWHNGSQLVRETSNEPLGIDMLDDEAVGEELSLLEAKDSEDALSAESRPLQSPEQDESHSWTESASENSSVPDNTTNGSSDSSEALNPTETKDS